MPRPWRLPLTSLALATLVLVAAPRASTQEPPAVVVDEAAGPPGGTPPVAPADIPSRADETLADLHRLEGLLEPTPREREIESGDAALRSHLIALRAQLDEIDAERISIRRLDDLRLGWSELQSQLDDWAATLEEQWRRLEYEQAQIERSTRQWTATHAAASREALPAETLSRIAEVLDRLAAVERRLRERADAVAGLIERVERERERAALAQERLGTAADRVRRRLLVRDSPPLWEVVREPQGAGLVRDLGEAARQWRAALLGFATERQGVVHALPGLFVVLLLAAYALRRRSRSWPEDDRERDTARFLASRPASTALVFTLAAGLPYLVRAVAPVRDLVGLLVMIAVLRLGGGLVAASERPALRAVVALSLLERLWALAPDGSLLQRLLLLLVILLALAGATLWIAQRSRRAAVEASDRHGPWVRAVTAALHGARALLLVSAVAVLLGWSSLAQLLTAGTVGAAFMAFAWLVVRNAAVALVPLVSRGALGRWLPSVLRHQAAFNERASRLLTLAALVAWAGDVLQRFELLGPVREGLRSALSASLTWGGLDLSAGRVLGALVVLLATWFVARLVRLVLREEVLPRFPLPAGADHSILTLVNYALLALGAVLAAAVAGLSGTQLTVVIGALGVGIGFGLQTIVNNFVSGLILMFERPIKVGDRVQTTDHFGIVTNIGIRASILRTFDGAEVMIPNGELISRDVINWTRSDMLRRVEVLVGVAYGTDPKVVLDILRRVARAESRVLPTPEPQAFMVRFGDSSLDFRLLAWARVEDFVDVTSTLNVAVDQAFREAGITIPFPQRDLHVRSVDEGAARALAGER